MFTKISVLALPRKGKHPGLTIMCQRLIGRRLSHTEIIEANSNYSTQSGSVGNRDLSAESGQLRVSKSNILFLMGDPIFVSTSE